MEEKIYFQSENFQIEGLLGRGSNDRSVVITHPHPLFGGDMYNVVVESLVRTYAEKGYTTLRFNFRGAGMSQGTFDEGKGEQADVMSAVSYIKENFEIPELDLAGYSFGAWVNALSSSRVKEVNRLVMIAPPVAFIDFKDVDVLPKLSLVVSGSKDEYAPPSLIKEMLPAWNPSVRFEVIDGADHFFFGHSHELESVVSEHL